MDRDGKGAASRKYLQTAKGRAAKARMYERRRRLVQDIKLARGCADCGYREHAEALDFDHRPGTTKLFSLSKMHGHSLEAVLAEVEKCDIVCANCHRVRTAER